LERDVGGKQLEAVFRHGSGKIGTAPANHAAEKNDFDARGMLQLGSDGETRRDHRDALSVLQQRREFEGGRAGVENEALTRLHELARGGGDGALGRTIVLAAVAIVELQHHPLGENGAAVSALDVGLVLEHGEIASDCHFTDVHFAGQFRDGDAWLLRETLANSSLTSGRR
jgi:hypothetical protein